MTSQSQAMGLDWTKENLSEGLRRYEAGEYFAAHEEWENVWLKAAEPDKTFLQALIQVTAALHHYFRDNRQGALLLLQAAIQRLDAFHEHFGSIVVAELRADIRKCIQVLESGDSGHQLTPPRIRSSTE